MIDPNPLAHLWWWFEIHLGITPKAPPAYYLAWSGSFSDVGEVTLITGVAFAIWHSNCHESGCKRLTRQTTPDGHKLCRKHLKVGYADLNLHDVHEDHRG